MIEQNELIERWANVERVLDAMPEHDRQRHWDMGTWGAVTDCGTVACAAGHCGLNPWFRERGFRLDLRDDGNAEISSVEEFFGLEGSSKIFLNPARRPVEAVVAEVRAYLHDLRMMAALTATAPVQVGEVWRQQGGVFAGARLGRDGGPAYFLIVGPEYDGGIDWYQATSWAAEIDAEGHHDYALPCCSEQQALFDRVRNLFQPVPYWSCEEFVTDSSVAWFHSFRIGYKDGWYKNYIHRARAVRRVFIR